MFLGDGQGGFGAESQLGVEDSTGSLAAADFNNDGHLDLATLNNDRSVSVLRGNGDSTFRPPVKTALPLWSMLHSVAAADFNGDGNMDLVYTAQGMDAWGSVVVLLGDGQGGFPAGHQYQLNTKNPYGLAVADLNADGRPDVVTTNFDYHDGAVSVLLGNGDGTLSYDSGSSNFATGLYPTDVAVGDFTGDGIPDLVTTSNAVGASLNVLPGRGDGTFAARISSQADSGYSLAAADFNGDGRLDVLVAGEGSDFYGPLNLSLGRGNGTFEGPEDVDTGGWNLGTPAAGDFNGDGRPDLAVGVNYDQNGTNSLAVMLNDGNWPPLVPSLRIGDVTVTEGNTGTRTATFTATLSAASSQTVTAAYVTANGTATAGSDFQSASYTVTFAPGETSKTVTVLIYGDRLGEPNETFVVNLSSPTN